MERTIGAEEIEALRPRCDYILDARSPAEYAEDHMAGAINTPALDDDQRAEIGAVYARDPFAARKTGALYALESVLRFVASPLVQDASKKTAFLVYCARGGLRSGAFSTTLSQIGFAVFRLKRGYKSYRAYALHTLAQPLPQPVYALYGNTGSRKTRVINRLRDRFNVIDLEGCAKHRGSILGDLPRQPQASQRAFETALMEEIRRFDPGKPTLLEGESRMIGRCAVPNALWLQMIAARNLWLETPRDQRAANILDDYRDLKDPAYLETRLNRLGRYLSHQLQVELHADMTAGRWPDFVDKLLAAHYDPLYARKRGECLEVITAQSVDQAAKAVAHTIVAEQTKPGGRR